MFAGFLGEMCGGVFRRATCAAVRGRTWPMSRPRPEMGPSEPSTSTTLEEEAKSRHSIDSATDIDIPTRASSRPSSTTTFCLREPYSTCGPVEDESSGGAWAGRAPRCRDAHTATDRRDVYYSFKDRAAPACPASSTRTPHTRRELGVRSCRGRPRFISAQYYIHQVGTYDTAVDTPQSRAGCCLIPENIDQLS